MAQLPLAHEAVPLFELQPLLQPPQWVVLMLRFASQPLARLPSQLPQPPVQTIPQLPPEQVAVPLVELQTVAHAPQLAGLLLVTVSQPLLTFASQLP